MAQNSPSRDESYIAGGVKMGATRTGGTRDDKMVGGSDNIPMLHDGLGTLGNGGRGPMYSGRSTSTMSERMRPLAQRMGMVTGGSMVGRGKGPATMGSVRRGR